MLTLISYWSIKVDDCYLDSHCSRKLTDKNICSGIFAITVFPGFPVTKITCIFVNIFYVGYCSIEYIGEINNVVHCDLRFYYETFNLFE